MKTKRVLKCTATLLFLLVFGVGCFGTTPKSQSEKDAARVLVRKRRILLLDEAFAALGPALRAELIEVVKKLVRDNNMAALLVSHQPRDALLASARTAFICAGKIISLEQTGDLLNHSQLPQVRDYLGSV